MIYCSKMASELRRSFKQKAKAAFGLPFRLKKGLDIVTGDDANDAGSDELLTSTVLHSNSFDIASLDYVTPSVTWLSSLTSNNDKLTVTECPTLDEQTKDSKKKTTNVVQPKGTLTYVVTNTDSLASIAAQFETTTSELKKCNRLMTDMVFPGKMMYIPDKDYIQTGSPEHHSVECLSLERMSEKERVDSGDNLDLGIDISDTMNMLKLTAYPLTNAPGLLLMHMRPIFASQPTSDVSKKSSTDDWQQQFIKLSVQHITQQQQVEQQQQQQQQDEVSCSGVLLVSTQVIMFERSLSEGDVNSLEEQSFFIPVDSIRSISMSRNKLQRTTTFSDRCCEDTVDDVFSLKDAAVTHSDLVVELPDLVVDQHDLVSACMSKSDVSYNNQPVDSESSQDVDISKDISHAIKDISHPKITDDNDTSVVSRDICESSSHSCSDTIVSSFLQDSISGAKRLPHAAFTILRYPYDSIRRRDAVELSAGSVVAATTVTPAITPAAITPAAVTRADDSVQPTASSDVTDSDQGLVSRTIDSISSLPSSLVDLSSSLFISGPSPPRSAADKSPSHVRTFLFQPFERLVSRPKLDSSDTELISQNLPECQVTAGELADSTPLYMCIKIGKKCNLVAGPGDSYIHTRLQSEYWFTVPVDRAEELYSFFVQWSPTVTNNDNEVNFDDRGFVVFEAANMANTSHSVTDWQLVNVKEVRRILAMSEVQKLPLPELSEASKILHSYHIRQLCFHLPARAEGCPWRLLYNTEKHGFSLKTLYRCMNRIDSATLLVVLDDSNQVFGAMLPCAVKVSDTFYGTGESYLFTFYEGFKTYGWTGCNTFFIKGNSDSLSIGAGDGVYGLWLDGDLYHGRTQWCLTYDNDLLTSTEDFTVRCLEVWTFT